MGDLSL
jgi:hypothetical protein